jgi:hypothetical protein
MLLLLLSLSLVWGFSNQAQAAGAPSSDPDYPMLASNPYTDPIASKPGDIDYSVSIQIINHGVSDLADETIPRLVHGVETIYSQCEGVRFHVNVVSGVEPAPYTTAQDDVSTSVLNGRIALGEGFQKFFSQFPNSSETGVIAVHLFDFLEAGARTQAKEEGRVTLQWLGQAFPALIMDNLYGDARLPEDQTGKLSDVGGNTIRLGMDTLKFGEGVQTHINEPGSTPKKPKVKIAWKSYQSSLLAHEMGHILMETQTGVGTFIDHFCPQLGTTCPTNYLMTAGGSGDHVYLRVPQMDTPIGYSPLPKVEPLQCEMLKHHPLVKVGN